MRIMTGAPIPKGADSIVMVEDTSKGPNDTVLVFRSTAVGGNIRNAGSDIANGDVVFSSYTEITPAVLGSLASIGLKMVPVIKRLRIAVISTGSELTDEVPLPLGKIRDSNRPSLMAAITEMGAEPVDYGPVPDDYDILKEVFTRASQECDAVVTSGGVSVGDFDYSKKVLEEISSKQMRWMQISIKPAKPFAFGMIGSKALFGLPGNPVSALVSFELFARPSIAMMMGNPNPFRTVTKASVEAGIKRSPDGKIHFLRSTVKFDQNGKLQCQLNDGQSSHMLNSLARSNALAVVPDGMGVEKKGLVEVMLLSRVL
jgi:molybdopterin molybdotransferase